MKLMMKFCLSLLKFPELEQTQEFSLKNTGVFSRSHGKCFRCCFRQLSMYLAVRKCKNDCETPKITLVPDFLPLNPEIARFSSGFRLNLPK